MVTQCSSHLDAASCLSIGARDAGNEYAMIDLSLACPSAQRRSAKKARTKPIGCGEGGLSTKIHATIDALGNQTSFHLVCGQACDLEVADVQLPQQRSDLLADKDFDADERVQIPSQQAGKTAVIPSKANRKPLILA